MTFLHIIAGLLGLGSGAVALYALKGARLHRRSGTLFVYAMLLMSASGAGMAAVQQKPLSVIAGALTLYLVTTALLTIRRPARPFHWISVVAMLAAATIGAVSIHSGADASNGAGGDSAGDSAAPYFIFGAVALLCAVLDLRMFIAGGVAGAHRMARHLWRMCFALFIAAASLFLGQPQVFPPALRNGALLSFPVLLVLALMFYWLARVLFAKYKPSGGARD